MPISVDFGDSYVFNAPLQQSDPLGLYAQIDGGSASVLPATVHRRSDGGLSGTFSVAYVISVLGNPREVTIERRVARSFFGHGGASRVSGQDKPPPIGYYTLPRAFWAWAFDDPIIQLEVRYAGSTIVVVDPQPFLVEAKDVGFAPFIKRYRFWLRATALPCPPVDLKVHGEASLSPTHASNSALPVDF